MATHPSASTGNPRQTSRWPPPTIDYYAVLGVDGQCADEKMLQKAYDEKALEWKRFYNRVNEDTVPDRLLGYGTVLIQARDALLDCNTRNAYRLTWCAAKAWPQGFREVQDLAGHLIGQEDALGRPKVPVRGCSPWEGAPNDPGRCTTPILQQDVLNGIPVGWHQESTRVDPVYATFTALGNLAMGRVQQTSTGVFKVAAEDITVGYSQNFTRVVFSGVWNNLTYMEFGKRLFDELKAKNKNITVWSSFEEMDQARDPSVMILAAVAQARSTKKSRRQSSPARHAQGGRGESAAETPRKRQKTTAPRSNLPLFDLSPPSVGSTSSTIPTTETSNAPATPQIPAENGKCAARATRSATRATRGLDVTGIFHNATKTSSAPTAPQIPAQNGNSAARATRGFNFRSPTHNAPKSSGPTAPQIPAENIDFATRTTQTIDLTSIAHDAAEATRGQTGNASDIIDVSPILVDGRHRPFHATINGRDLSGLLCMASDGREYVVLPTGRHMTASTGRPE